MIVAQIHLQSPFCNTESHRQHKKTTTQHNAMADTSQPPVAEHSEPQIYTSLTYAPLDPSTHLAHVRSPDAGALVLFAGTTRSTFDNRPVANLTYQAYVPLAMSTLNAIARELVSRDFDCGDGTQKRIQAIAITHRLGVVPIGEESILIAVAAAHRTEAWRAGEECLEEVKKRTEIWKLETFADGNEAGEAVWRANNKPKEAVAKQSLGNGEAED